MTLGKRLALAGFVVTAVLIATGTGGFSAMAADRSLQVSVVEDEHAFLGIEVVEREGTVGNTQFTLLELTDNFGQDVDVDEVTVASEDAPIEVELPSEATSTDGDFLAMDDTLDVPVSCTEPTDGAVDVTLHIVASGTGVTVVKDKTVGVECSPPAESNPGVGPTDPETVQFRGCGNVFVPDGYAVETYVYYQSGSGNSAGTYTEQDTEQNGPAKLVGIVTAGNGTYANSNFDFESTTCSAGSDDRGAGQPVDGTPPWDQSADSET